MGSAEMSDDEFLAAFLDCSMPPAGFDHHGHMRAAWLMLQRFALQDAVDRTCAGIARLAAHLGAAGKFHWTVTEALMRLMAGGGAADPQIPFEEFVRINAPLFDDARGVLARHYSPERLASPDARERFLAPDRLPLPHCTA